MNKEPKEVSRLRFCECCKRPIRDTECIYHIEISKMLDKERILDNICEDCYDDVVYAIDNAEKFRNRRMM